METNEKQYIQYPEVGCVYKHYKGGKYKVIAISEHSETKEKVVIYQSLAFHSYHVRPLSMWFDRVEMAKGDPNYNSLSVNNTTKRFDLIT